MAPRGFAEITTRYGAAMLREDVIPLPPLEPHPGNVAYVDTETTGLSGGSGTLVFAAAVITPGADRPLTGQSVSGLLFPAARAACVELARAAI